jgi:hypothetical protein
MANDTHTTHTIDSALARIGNGRSLVPTAELFAHLDVVTGSAPALAEQAGAIRARFADSENVSAARAVDALLDLRIAASLVPA